MAIADVEEIDLARKQVRIRHPDLPDAYEVTYDQVVLALGAVTNFYHTPRLGGARVHDEDSGRRDACRRNGLIDSLELADNQPDETRRRTTLTVVVAGGGFRGSGNGRCRK